MSPRLQLDAPRDLGLQLGALGAGLGQHGGRDVDADDGEAALGQREGQPPGAGAQLQDRAARPGRGRHRSPGRPPAARRRRSRCRRRPRSGPSRHSRDAWRHRRSQSRVTQLSCPMSLRRINGGAKYQLTRLDYEPLGEPDHVTRHPDPPSRALALILLAPLLARRLRRQHHPDQGRGRQGQVGGGAEPVPAPRRPDPEPGQHREGLRGPGEVDAGRGDRGPRLGDPGQGRRLDDHQPGRSSSNTSRRRTSCRACSAG